MELVAKEYAVTEQEKNDLEVYINDAVEVLKANHAEMNKFVMKSVSALSASKARSKELASQGFFGRLWGSITGKNRRMQNAINMSNTQAIYAVGQAVKKLAEQNAMSFELITAVNNKLNHAIVGINEEINELKSNLVVLFKQSRSEIAQLNQRVDALEKCADLERWHDTVEYLTFNDMNYEELPPIDALVCLTNDFYVKSHGEWTFSDLLLLKSTFKELDINLKEKISYKDFVDEIVARPELRDRLFEGIDIHSTVDYIPAYTLLDKKSKLAGEEKYICDTVAELSGKDSGEEISNYLVEQYAISNVGVDYNAGINIFDFSLELLAGLKGYEWQENEIVDMLDEAEDVEVPALAVPKIDWEKYPFPQYRRIAVSEESTLMIDNDGVVHAWGADESINNVPEIDECCVSVGMYYYKNGYTMTGSYNGRIVNIEHFSIALAIGESKKLYYWGDYPDEVKTILSKIDNVRCLAENGFPIVLEDGYCIDLKIDYKDGKYFVSKKELSYNVKVISGCLHSNGVDNDIYMGIGVNNKVVYEKGSKDDRRLWERSFEDDDKFVYASCGKDVGVATTNSVLHIWGRYYKNFNDKYGCSFSCSKYVKDVVYADYLLDRCGKIICLNKKGSFEIVNVIDLCEKYFDGVTGEYRDKDSRYYLDVVDGGVSVNGSVISMEEIVGACRAMNDVVALQICIVEHPKSRVYNIGDALVGMIALDKDCKVYYIGYFGEEELCKQGMPDEFKI